MKGADTAWKVLIVEDEYPAQDELERLLGLCNDQGDVKTEILAKTDTVAGTVDWLEQNSQSVDLIFMDIHLADGEVFEVFRRIKVEVPIIFTTAYDEYAIKAFEVNSIDYLLKPVELEALQQALSKFDKLQKAGTAQDNSYQLTDNQVEALIQGQGKQYPQRLVISCGDKFRRLEIDDIAYFFADDKYVFAVTRDGRRQLVENTLEELGGMLNPKQFYRVNRRYLAQNFAIQEVERFFNRRLSLKLHPEPADQVLVSRLKAKNFLNWLQG